MIDVPNDSQSNKKKKCLLVTLYDFVKYFPFSGQIVSCVCVCIHFFCIQFRIMSLPFDCSL